jgi:hypothetical protein
MYCCGYISIGENWKMETNNKETRQMLERNGKSTIQFISYLLTSRKLMVNQEGRLVQYSRSVWYPHETGKANKNVSDRNL